jgi:hypothetical protein
MRRHTVYCVAVALLCLTAVTLATVSAQSATQAKPTATTAPTTKNTSTSANTTTKTTGVEEPNAPEVKQNSPVGVNKKFASNPLYWRSVSDRAEFVFKPNEVEDELDMVSAAFDDIMTGFDVSYDWQFAFPLAFKQALGKEFKSKTVGEARRTYRVFTQNMRDRVLTHAKSSKTSLQALERDMIDARTQLWQIVHEMRTVKASVLSEVEADTQQMRGFLKDLGVIASHCDPLSHMFVQINDTLLQCLYSQQAGQRVRITKNAVNAAETLRNFAIDFIPIMAKQTLKFGTAAEHTADLINAITAVESAAMLTITSMQAQHTRVNQAWQSDYDSIVSTLKQSFGSICKTMDAHPQPVAPGNWTVEPAYRVPVYNESRGSTTGNGSSAIGTPQYFAKFAGALGSRLSTMVNLVNQLSKAMPIPNSLHKGQRYDATGKRLDSALERTAGLRDMLIEMRKVMSAQSNDIQTKYAFAVGLMQEHGSILQHSLEGFIANMTGWSDRFTAIATGAQNTLGDLVHEAANCAGQRTQLRDLREKLNSNMGTINSATRSMELWNEYHSQNYVATFATYLGRIHRQMDFVTLARESIRAARTSLDHSVTKMNRFNRMIDSVIETQQAECKVF